MRSKPYRRPSPALIVALLALIVAVTPVADAATGVVARALNANNSARVNGIKASKTPKAGQLLALGKNKKFPKSVLPLTAGPQGPPGPQGPAGSNATINGVTAGGALAGTYPNPTLAPGAVGLTELGVIPAARIERGTAQTITSGSVNTVTFNSEVFDTAALYNPANPTCLEAPVTGIYALTAGARWASNGTGTRFMSFDLGGARLAAAWQNATAGAETDMNIATLAKVNVGQCVRLIVYQNTGGSLDLVQASVSAPSFTMHWVAKA